MARRSTSWVPAWLRHRQLITTEAVLLVAVGQELAQRWITAAAIPGWAKTLEVMAVNAGILGGLLWLATALARGSLSGAHRAVGAMPAAMLLLHIAAFAGIFLLYASVWNFLLPWQPPPPP
jgi:hypothetical protein